VIVLWALVGCVVGVGGVRVVDELTMVATVLEPPRPVAGTDVAVEVWLANPDRVAVDVLVWTCVPAPGGCAESRLESARLQRTWRPEVDGVTARTVVALPELPAEVWDDDDELSVIVWTLGCVRGRCDVFDRLDADPEDPSLHAVLDDPLSWTDLPGFGEAALGFRTVKVLREVTEIPNRNPRVLPLRADGQRVSVVAYDPDERDQVEVRAVTTAGTWEDGRWTGRDAGRLFVVVTDGRDGAAVEMIER
jgi:hypothetical protein